MMFSQRKFARFDAFQQERKILLLLRRLEEQLVSTSFTESLELLEEVRQYLCWLHPAHRIAATELLAAIDSLRRAGQSGIACYCEAANPLVWQGLSLFGIVPRDDNLYVKTQDNDTSLLAIDSIVPVVCDLRSPFNLGAIMRTSEFFGLTQMVVMAGDVALHNPRLARTAKGCEQLLTVTCFADEATFLDWIGQQATARLWGIETTDDSRHVSELAALDPSCRHFLLFGNEEYGLKQSLLARCHGVFSVPSLGHKNSLNVACMASLVLYEATRSLAPAPGEQP